MAAAESGVQAVTGHQADLTPGHETGVQDAGDGRQRQLEGRRAVLGAPEVGQDRDPSLPGHLVLADHELIGAGGRRPVDPSQVVARLVGAQGVEVLAAVGQRRMPGRAGGIGASRLGQRVDGVDSRVHHEGGAGRRLTGLSGQAEGVGQADRERSKGENAPLRGGQPVGGPDRFAGLQGRDVKTRPTASIVEGIAGRKHRRAAAVVVAYRQLHPAVASGVNLRGPDLTVGHDVPRSEADVDDGARQEAQPDHCQGVKLRDTEQTTGGHEGDRGAAHRPAAAGEGGDH